MDVHTARRLNQINENFYAATASDFHATRGTPWRGWELMLAHLPVVVRILDVGCGNGRFGIFMAEAGYLPLVYHGLDNSEALLSFARQSLANCAGVEAAFERHDLVEALLALPAAPFLQTTYDLVVIFGVIHHIPGAEHRLHLMRTLASCVAPGGVLAFACWRFYEQARFRERIVPWEASLGGKVEAGDYLLDWKRGTHALRYCHHVDDREHDALVAATRLQEIARYRADGETGDANAYSILRAGASIAPHTASPV